MTQTLTEAADAATAEPAAATQPSSLTTYQLLVSYDDGLSWVPLEVVSARSRTDAISVHFKNGDALPDEAETWSFQAVPVSSWKPLRARRRPGISVGEA